MTDHRSPMRSSLGRVQARQPLDAEELAAMRRAAWRQQGILAVSEDDRRLTCRNANWCVSSATNSTARGRSPAMVDESTWTPKLVDERIEEAADTLRRLPEERRHTNHANWPPIIRDFWEMYGVEPARLRLGPPPAAAIDRMDQTLEWLRWVEPDEARLLWWRATRTPWKVIEKKLGVSRQTAWRQWTCALIKISSLLNGRSRKNVATKKRVTKHPQYGTFAV